MSTRAKQNKTHNRPSTGASRQGSHGTPAATLLAGILALSFAAGAAQAAEKNGEPAPALLVRKGEQLLVPADSPLRARLVVAPVAAQALPHGLAIPAVVEADPALNVNVLPPLTGRVVELKAGLGDVVKRGQLLAVISSPDLAQAYADVDKAKDTLSLTRRALERAQGVNEAGGAAQKDLEAAQSAYNQALAEDQRAASRLKTLAGGGEVDMRSRLLRINAPVAGTVTSLAVGNGAFINDPTAPLMSIANLERVWVTAQVPEDQIGAITRGQAVELRLAAYPGLSLRGTVGSVSPLLEPDTRRAKVRITLANPDGRLKPNMFATARFAVPQAAQVVVPTSALLMNNDSVTVFVESAPWTFVRRTVELGTEDGERVRILSGLKSGERVVVRGGVLLND
ncbi:MAG TPA: efflux RND transporter periplasmic adaptor subunit [Methylibium sp.]